MNRMSAVEPTEAICATSHRELLRGDNFRWRVGRLIGTGSFGSVSLAYDETGREAAIKYLKPEFVGNEVFNRRMLCEFEVMRALNHATIPCVFDQGLTRQDVPFFAMEYLHGQTLETRRLRNAGRLELPVVLNAATHVLVALDHAHSRGVIHRDVTPNNIFITSEGRVKLLDFGICQAIECSGALEALALRRVIGTPGFIAPEQARGHWKKLDSRTDLWSLGSALFVLLTGESVHLGTAQEQIELASRHPARSIRAVMPDLPPDLADWLDRTLAFDPAERWSSAGCMLRALFDVWPREMACVTLPPEPEPEPVPISSIEAPSTLENTGPVSSARRAQLVLCLVHSSDQTAAQTTELSPTQELVIGRDPKKANVCLNDTHISRRHATIRWNGARGAFVLADQSSRNGIEINGLRSAARELAVGDLIRIGQSLWIVADATAKRHWERQLNTAATGSSTMLITGETGVGKDRLAREIHRRSNRKGELIAVNCASLSHSLAGAELFGHERGAFTGAVGSHLGLIRAAQQGTLLLDEVGDMPLDLQSLLLRVLQERSVRPVGGNKEIPIDVRIIAATNANLQERLQEGRFRLDLFARLTHLTLHVPPLRMRREQILSIIGELTLSDGLALRLNTDAAEAILLWHWPTNVRGLQRLVAHIKSHESKSRTLNLSMLRECDSEIVDNWKRLKMGAGGKNLDLPNPSDILRNRGMLRQYIANCEGNITQVARQLNVGRNQVYRWMARLDIRSVRSSSPG